MAISATSAVIELGDIEKMKVTDLKRELKIRGLSAVGNKGDLVERLQLSLHSEIVGGAGTEDVNEDDVLGDVDGILDEDPKGDNSSLNLADDEIIMSPVKKINSLVPTLEMGGNALNLVRTKTATATAVVAPSPTIIKPKLSAVLEEADDKVSPVISTPIGAQDRLQLRAKRFNVPAADDTKKQARAERFGTPAKNPTNGASLEKLQQRAQRFGQSISPSIKQLEEKDRLLKRKERFGAVTAVVLSSGKVDVDEKKKKRAERFGLN